MAVAGSVSPMLKIRRSTQSGGKPLTAVYAAVYTEDCSQPFVFVGGIIDLSTMQAGDTIQIRTRKRVALGGAWLAVDEVTYLNAQPAGHTAVLVQGMTGIYDIEISMRQTAGVLRTVDTEFMDAKRVGLE